MLPSMHELTILSFMMLYVELVAFGRNESQPQGQDQPKW
jgi:hypothetical protein